MLAVLFMVLVISVITVIWVKFYIICFKLKLTVSVCAAFLSLVAGSLVLNLLFSAAAQGKVALIYAKVFTFFWLILPIIGLIVGYIQRKTALK
jgi:hypothetical protein